MTSPLRPLLACALLCLAACSSETDAASSRLDSNAPNIVLISLDTLRADHLSAYGYGRETSPELDDFASKSVLFEQAYSHSPVTAPSHMTVLTGLLPDTHGVQNWSVGRSSARRLSDDVPTLASILGARGYRTAAVTGGGNVSGDLGFDIGFETYDEQPGSVRETFRDGLDRIEEFGDEPYFLFLHTYGIHDPYTPPARYAELFVDPGYDGAILGDSAALREYIETLDRGEGRHSQMHKVFWDLVDPDSPADVQHLIDLYDGAIRHVDDRLGWFLGKLRKTEGWSRTMVVILSDHGEEFFEHGGSTHRAMYQEVLHVPLLMRLPNGRVEGRHGERVTDLVGLVDVLPTVLDVLNVPAPEALQGTSLLDPGMPLARPRLDGAERESHFAYWPKGDVWALRRDGRKLIVNEGEGVPPQHREPGPWAELYDLDVDPGERADLATREPDRVEQLRAIAEELRADHRRAREALAAAAEIELDAESAAHLEALGYADDDDED